MDVKSKSPIKLWHIILIMVVCGFAVGLVIGLIQSALGIQLPGGAAVGAAIGAVGGLLLGRRWAKTQPEDKTPGRSGT